MTLTAMLSRLYRRFNLSSSPAAGDTSRLTDFINDAYRELMADPILQKLRNRNLPVSTVANSVYMALPVAIVEVYHIVNRTNQSEIVPKSVDWIRSQDPGRTSSSTTPIAYAVVDMASSVKAQPSDSSQLYVKSSAAGDTTQTAYIEVVTNQGYVRQSSVTLNGTTAATLGPADSIDIEDFYLSATCVGEVTLTEDSGVGTELARIGIGQTRQRCILTEIFPKPSSAVSLFVDCKVAVTDLVNGTDEPLIPDEFSEAIILGAEAREWYKREKDKQAEKRELKVQNLWVPRLHKYIHTNKAYSSNSAREPRFSQLGPYYPPGS